MFLRKVSVENARSFLEKQTLTLEGNLSIVIGPNGGGKTNLLDAAICALRRHLYASPAAEHSPTPEHPDRHVFHENPSLARMGLDRHNHAPQLDQVIEVEIEVTDRDIENMKKMRDDRERLLDLSSLNFASSGLEASKAWNIDTIKPKARLTYRIVNGQLQHSDAIHETFRQYLALFEVDALLRNMYDLSPLSTPILFLPSNRAQSGLSTTVDLPEFSEYGAKQSADAANSRTQTTAFALAVGRIARRYRRLIDSDGNAEVTVRSSPEIDQLTTHLRELGYEWSLFTVSAERNRYDIRLEKQGAKFLVGSASSGERELLTYLFVLYALNVRDALVIVDEPELHLHPVWQKKLLGIFGKLSKETGNQFLLATHSPVFVSPDSIHSVSRVFSDEMRSRIASPDTSKLPRGKNLVSIINSQNNERVFFADEVVLVEGPSDRIFFEAAILRRKLSKPSGRVIEVVEVGGKGLFSAYSSALDAFKIPFSIIGDRDYLEQIGSPETKALFSTNANKIKKDVIENVRSKDGDALVKAIDQAISEGDWTGASDLWDYIKGSRRKLNSELSEKELEILLSSIEKCADNRVYVLKEGSLEDYLPSGYKAKDIDKLIELVSAPDFWDQLPPQGKPELETIITRILGKN